ncbi:MAG: hypothetical protein IKT52_12240 [Oscillospiraceae bacterium]|nr:hypothetical protein [Oscillospiraceae bacterium]
MKSAGRILVLLFVVILFGLAIANLPLTFKALEEGAAAGQGLAGVSETLRKAYLTDEFWQKNQFVNINGLYARFSGRRELNDVVLMRNGMLGYSGNAKRSMSLQTAGITQFSEWLHAIGSDFLYVQMPYKLDLEGKMLPVGHEDGLHANATALLDALKARDVHVLDLRTDICATVAQVEKYFYPTDHHWSARGAMKGFQLVTQRVQELFPYQPILKSKEAKTANWREHTLKNYFLGSQGKRVGQLYAGVDDLVWYTPQFDTSMSMYIPKYRKFTAGTFQDAVMQMHYVEEKPDYFNLSPYNVYIGGDYPLVVHRNGQAPVDLKVLIIKDSFTLPLQSFMSTVFTAVEVIDPRHYTEKPIAEYIRQSEPDLVILAVNPAGLSLPEYYSFDTPDAHEYYELTTVFGEPVSVAAKAGGYNYTSIPVTLEASTLYHVELEGLTATQGQTSGVSLVLYNRNENKFLDSWVIDLDYYARTGKGTWYFCTPETAGCELLMYAGVQGNTDGIGVTCSRATVAKVSTAYPEGYAPLFKTLISTTDVKLSPRDDAHCYQALAVKMEGDTEYTLTLDGVTLDVGDTQEVLLALYDSGAKKRVVTHTARVDSAGGGSVSWTFRTPAENEEMLKLLLYAGMPGKTNHIGVTYRGLTLVKHLVDNAEEQNAETTEIPAETLVARSEMQEKLEDTSASEASREPSVVMEAASEKLAEDHEQPLPEQSMEETTRVLPQEYSFAIAASDSDYNYERIPLSLEPGAAYVLKIDSLSLTAGTADTIEVTLYSPEKKEHLAIVQLPLQQQSYRWMFRAPEGTQDCQLLVYAGKRGSTKGMSLEVNNLSMNCMAEAPTKKVVYLQDVTLMASEEQYHYEALEIVLEPNTEYRLSVDEVVFQSGASDVLSVSLYDQASKTHLLRSELPLTTGGELPACEWTLRTPEGDSSTWKLLVYAGDRSNTTGIGVTCHGVMVVED